MAYFSNGSEGETLEAQCRDCPLGYGWEDPNQSEMFGDVREPRPCPTYAIQGFYNYDQVEKGNEKLRDAMRFLVNDKGECQTRKQLVEIRIKQST